MNYAKHKSQEYSEYNTIKLIKNDNINAENHLSYKSIYQTNVP